jgi:hypothetical protein
VLGSRRAWLRRREIELAAPSAGPAVAGAGLLVTIATIPDAGVSTHALTVTCSRRYE